MTHQHREVRTRHLITYALLPPLFTLLIWLFPVAALTRWWPVVSPRTAVILYILAGLFSYFALRRFLIGLVLVYKAFAPMHVREQCRFEPTCSTYMMMAIQKYGIIVGVIKGIRRLLRCKPPNGGIDYP